MKKRRKQTTSIWKLAFLILIVAGGCWLILVSPARSHHASLVRQLAQEQVSAQKHAASTSIAADSLTLRAGARALLHTDSAQVRSFVFAAAATTKTAVSSYKAESIGAFASARVSVSASPSEIGSFLARLTGNVVFTKSGELRASGPLYTLSALHMSPGIDVSAPLLVSFVITAH
jgi:hypothetical protein